MLIFQFSNSPKELICRRERGRRQQPHNPSLPVSPAVLEPGAELELSTGSMAAKRHSCQRALVCDTAVCGHVSNSTGQRGRGSESRCFSEMFLTRVWHVWSLPALQRSEAPELNARAHIWKDETAASQGTDRLQGPFRYELSSLLCAAASWVSCSINISSININFSNVHTGDDLL